MHTHVGMLGRNCVQLLLYCDCKAFMLLCTLPCIAFMAYIGHIAISVAITIITSDTFTKLMNAHPILQFSKYSSLQSDCAS